MADCSWHMSGGDLSVTIVIVVIVIAIAAIKIARARYEALIEREQR